MNTKSATTWKIQQLGQQFNYTIAITREKKKEKKIDTMDGTSSVAQNPLKELSDLSFQGLLDGGINLGELMHFVPQNQLPFLL